MKLSQYFVHFSCKHLNNEKIFPFSCQNLQKYSCFFTYQISSTARNNWRLSTGIGSLNKWIKFFFWESGLIGCWVMADITNFQPSFSFSTKILMELSSTLIVLMTFNRPPTAHGLMESGNSLNFIHSRLLKFQLEWMSTIGQKIKYYETHNEINLLQTFQLVRTQKEVRKRLCWIIISSTAWKE